ncbi:MAG: hypothetical protein WC549_04630 [Actinomycetota bacterium]
MKKFIIFLLILNIICLLFTIKLFVILGISKNNFTYIIENIIEKENLDINLIKNYLGVEEIKSFSGCGSDEPCIGNHLTNNKDKIEYYNDINCPSNTILFSDIERERCNELRKIIFK